MDNEEYTLKKRLPKHLPTRKTDIYVTKKTNFKAQIIRCQKLFDAGATEIAVHGLGAAVNRAVNLALQFQQNCSGSVEISAHTSTVDLVDDLEPETDDFLPQTQMRCNSAIHIRIYRKEPESVEKQAAEESLYKTPEASSVVKKESKRKKSKQQEST